MFYSGSSQNFNHGCSPLKLYIVSVVINKRHKLNAHVCNRQTLNKTVITSCKNKLFKPQKA